MHYSRGELFLFGLTAVAVRYSFDIFFVALICSIVLYFLCVSFSLSLSVIYHHSLSLSSSCPVLSMHVADEDADVKYCAWTHLVPLN